MAGKSSPSGCSAAQIANLTSSDGSVRAGTPIAFSTTSASRFSSVSISAAEPSTSRHSGSYSCAFSASSIAISRM